MNGQIRLTDEAIRAAFARRATSGGERDLRERVLAAAAALPQRRGWRVRIEHSLVLRERRATLTLAATVLLLLAMAFGAAVVGSLLNRTSSLGALTYLSGGDLYVAGPAGESPRLAWDAPDTVVLSQPMWVDAETVLVQARRLVDGIGSVYLVEIGSAPRLIDDGGELLALSPDHRRIATGHSDGGTRSLLWIFDLEAGSRTADLGDIPSRTPLAWSPDGQWLLGEGLREGGSATSGWIYRVDAQTGATRDLAIDLCCGLHQPRPVLSPDGSQVVFVNYHQAVQGESCDFRCGTLWALDPESGAREQLTADDGSEIGPMFSPDGSWIAFMESSFGHAYDVAILRPDGTEHRKLTSTGDAFAPAANLEPFRYLAWDPDGRGLTFMRVRPGEAQVVPGETEFELWHVTLDGVAMRIEAPAISEFARKAPP